MGSQDTVETLNFASCGIRWTVRLSSGERLRFFTLQDLRRAIEDGQINTVSSDLTFDEVSWRRMSDIPDLRTYFQGVFNRYRTGQHSSSMAVIDHGIDDIEDDAPTTITMPDSLVSAAIQQAFARELAARVEEKALPPSLPPAVPVQPSAPSPVIEYALLGAGGAVLVAGLAMWLGFL